MLHCESAAVCFRSIHSPNRAVSGGRSERSTAETDTKGVVPNGFVDRVMVTPDHNE